MKRKCFYILSICIFFGFLSACYANNLPHGIGISLEGGHTRTTSVITHYVPPPHAPAHGYRHHHHNHDLQFDAGFGAYIVIGNPSLYFYNDHYVRFYRGGWQIRGHLNNRWRSAHINNIPHKLRKQHAQKHQRHNTYYNEPPNHRRHQGHELSYDAHTGAYVIINWPGIYFYNNRYLRHHRGRWQSANKLHGAWRPAKKHHVSKKLMQVRHPKKHKHKNQHRSTWY